MRFHYTNLETCPEATGAVIVIDVIRAFSNAAYAFGRGAAEIYPVSTVEEAFALKAALPNSLACGEVGGLPPEGFDFGNSPTQTNRLDLHGHALVQRTGAGTQGITRSRKAETLLAASLVVAGATAAHVHKLGIEVVTFVITGQGENGRGDEDLACAEYLEALLRGQAPDPAPFVERVYNSHDARLHLDPKFPDFPESDLDLCTRIDAFDFAMPVTRENGRPVMRAVTWTPEPGAPMYTLGVKREFIARHFLIGGDWGPENFPNSHHYVLELQLEGKELDPHGYLVDIVEVEKQLDAIVNYYKEQLLNDKPEFAGLNPSIEHFSRILCTTLNKKIEAQNISGIKVVLWENESAWTAYQIKR